jgi:hypothetical protein
LLLDAAANIDHCILAFHNSARLIQCDGGPEVVEISCSDSYGNAAGDWTDWCVEAQAGLNGNFSADPLFCDGENGDLTLDGDSPCLPDHHPEGYPCGLIGALGAGCGATAVEPVTWGTVKTRFRD